MNVTGVDFIAIPTQDFDRADAFYGDVLGLERSKRWGDMPAGEFETGSAHDRADAVRRVRHRVRATTATRSRSTSTTSRPRARSSRRRA